MKALVTGCAGYIGTMLCRQLLASGYHVIGIDNLMYNQQQSLLPLLEYDRFQFEKMDVVEITHAMDSLYPFGKLLKDCDIVFHLAALVGFPLCDDKQFLAEQTHVSAMKRLAQVMSKDQVMVYPVTNSGYGQTDGTTVCTEDSPIKPVSIYGHTKLEAEQVIRDSDINHVCLRLATVFGPSFRMRRDLLVNDLVWNAYKQGCNVIFNGNAMRNYVHINDVIAGMQFCAENHNTWNQVYNLGNDDLNMSKLNLAYAIAEIIPSQVIEADIGEDPDKRDYIVSSQKIYDTGFQCQWDLPEGIRALQKVYRAIDTPVMGNY